MAKDRQTVISEWSSIVGVLLSVAAIIPWVIGLMKPHIEFPSLSGLPRLQAILFIGLASALAHGILWTLLDRIFHWNFQAGGHGALPEGWSAIAQSATVTLPLILLPPLYAQLLHVQIVPAGHALASCTIVVCAALGHLVLYGSQAIKLPGLRPWILPLNSLANRRRGLAMEAIYGVVHFSSIVLAYRYVIAIQAGSTTENIFLPALMSAFLWFCGVSTYICLRYPESLNDKGSIGLRGLINGLMLLLTLQGGMLM